MAEERPITPPLRAVVSEFHTPSPTVTFFTELVNRDDPAYVQNAPVKRGTLYSSIIGGNRLIGEQFPLLYFLRERKAGLSDQQVFWDWSTEEEAEDTYNAEVNYVANNVNYPAFTRVSTIRRDAYEDDPTLGIGSTLTALLGVTIESGGQNYTYATGTIQDKDVEIRFVISEGEIISGVVTKEGSGVLATDTIIVTGDGIDATVIPIVQPTTCYLTSQKKQELPPDDPLANEFVRVIRVYETLPGPFLTTTRFDKDGVLVTISTRRNIAADIVDGENIVDEIWTRTTHNPSDSFVSEEVVSRRSVPGNPIVSTKIETDGKPLTQIKTLVETGSFVSSEVLSGSGPYFWIKTYEAEVADTTFVEATSSSNIVSWKMVESREIPGNVITSERVEDDGGITYIFKRLQKLTDISPGETINGSGVWIKTYADPVGDLVAWEVVEQRQLPGNPMVTTRVEDDGKITFITKVLGDTSTIVSSEEITGGNWIRTFKEPVSDLVAFQVQEIRPIPGTDVNSATIGNDYQVANIKRLLRDESLITSSSSESGGFVTTVEKKEVTDLVSNQITTVKRWTDTAGYSVSIPEGIIPLEFRASITTTVETHIIPGTASMPTLAVGEFEHSKKQIDKLFYEERITKLADLDFPVEQSGHETSSEFGGAVLDVKRTLSDVELFADEGENIVSSVVNPIGDNLMWFKETKMRPATDATWPILTEYDQDPETLSLITTTYQVIDAASVSAPSIVGGVITRYKKIDKWRSLEIIETYSIPASYEEQRFMAHNFPSLWDFTTYFYSTDCGPVGPIREGFSSMVQARVSIYFTTDKQTIVGLTLIPNTHHLVHDVVPGVLNDEGTLTYAGDCSGTVDLPPSSPTYTTYVDTIQNTEQLITGESVLWRAGLYKNMELYVTML